MSSPRYRPKRRLKSEIFPLAAVLSLPVALYFAFPRGVIGFQPASPKPAKSAYNAVVRLTPRHRARLIAAARSSWQSDSSSRRTTRANLLNLGPETTSAVASGLRPSVRAPVITTVDYECDHLPSGLAAEPPSTLEPQAESVPEPAFPSAELLKLN